MSIAQVKKESDWEEPLSEAVVVSPKNKKTDLVKTSCNALLIILLGFPLFYGGKQTLAISTLSTLTFILSIFVIYKISASQKLRSELKIGKLSRKLTVISSIFLGYVLFQSTPLPIFITKLISPSAGEPYLNSGASFAPVSINNSSTFSSLVWLLTLFFIALWFTSLPEKLIKTRVTSSRKKRKKEKSLLFEKCCLIDSTIEFIQRGIVFTGIFCSIIALAHLTTHTEYLFNIFNPERGRLSNIRAHWPFVNPNHLAVLIEMSLIIAIGRLLRGTQLLSIRNQNYSGRKLGLQIIRKPEKLGALVSQLICIFVLLLAGTLTLSKMGNALMWIGVILMWKGYNKFAFKPLQNETNQTRNSKENKIKSTLGRGFIFLFFVTIVLFFAGETGRSNLAERVEYGLAANTEQARIALYGASLETFSSFPIFGTGLGNWGLATYSKVPSSLAGWKLDFAHNDYLQLLAETGLLGALIVFSFMFVLAKSTLKAFKSELLPTDKILLLTTSLTIALPMIHALVDFPFHIPAISLIFTVALICHLRIVDKILTKPLNHQK